MNVLVIGSGGREHALVWKISKSKLVGRLYCAPGNPGIGELCELVPIAATDLNGLVGFAKEHHVDLAVVGPEQPLAGGIVGDPDFDHLQYAVEEALEEAVWMDNVDLTLFDWDNDDEEDDRYLSV